LKYIPYYHSSQDGKISRPVEEILLREQVSDVIMLLDSKSGIWVEEILLREQVSDGTTKPPMHAGGWKISTPG